ncbi:DUF2147 domain-containing protein [Xanthobacteraceae bacterium Astr-EGSB]|uniref:DUF2147 domain-containing protein n=1 Tax=Astrobacterium formosum TaxID=3069710 RepID=UPI0027ADE4FE|nr:DUF2147 domain-containing protein [Xanthobacteraceae bacterium Astr-EGSB]
MIEHRCACAVLAAAFLGLAGGTAIADPSGRWLVADRSAVMKIEACTDGYYASIDWERVPGIDAKNPDKAKRGRPLSGISILLGMKPTGTNEWEGRVYNPKDGNTYPAQMSEPRPDQVRIEGCVLGGMICDGETWTRVPTATTGAAPVDDKSYCPK